MARYGVETKHSPEKVIEMALVYFGEAGLGLDVVEQGPCCISFEGGGGHVHVTSSAEEERTTVDLETREWEYHAKKFAEKLH